MQMEKHNLQRLKRLFLARLLASIVLLAAFFWWDTSVTGLPHHPFSNQIFGVWLMLLVVQIALFRYPTTIVANLSFQLASDLLLIGLLVFGSGGIASPFTFLLGVVVIIAGTQARVLIVLVAAVLACITYLSAIYIHAGLYLEPISHDYTLRMLLQTSVLLLVGGIMALIARRHADLEREQESVVSKHRRLQELHSQVLGAMQEGIVVLSEKFIVQDFNHATSTILGVSKQYVGKDLSNILQVPNSMREFIQQSTKLVFRCECQHHNQPLLLTLTRLLEEDSAWLLTIVHLGEVRKLERQLAEQDKLASIGQMAAMLAHEIRNPMQTIAQAVELMGLGQSKLNLERIIGDEISRLNRLVSDMLDYAHPLYPHPQRTNIKAHIQASIQQVDLTNKHQVQMDAPSLDVYMDADHFRLLLDNLLRNAMLSSPSPASIFVSCVGDGTQWKLLIRDHGQGIPPSIRDKLFEPFQTGRKKGVGLGLATVSQVCAANDWLIAIDDTIEDGACFIVTGHINNEMMGGDEHG